MELRLIDPNGCTVSTGIRADIDPTQRDAVEHHLRTVVAKQDMLTNGLTADGHRHPGFRLDAYRVQASPEGVDCIGCHRDHISPLTAFWVPTAKVCPRHQTAPAEAVADRIREAIPYPYGDKARVTVTIEARGGITVAFTATRMPSMDAAEDLWATLAKACGIPPAWATLLISPSDNEIKARVKHGWVDPGMDCEYHQGVPVRLVAHGWAAMRERAERRAEEMEKFLASLPPRTVPAQGGMPGYTVMPIREGAVLPDGATITAVENPLGSAWAVTVDSGEERYVHKYAELRRYTTGRLVLVEPEWAGWASN